MASSAIDAIRLDILFSSFVQGYDDYWLSINTDKLELKYNIVVLQYRFASIEQSLAW